MVLHQSESLYFHSNLDWNWYPVLYIDFYPVFIHTVFIHCYRIVFEVVFEQRGFYSGQLDCRYSQEDLVVSQTGVVVSFHHMWDACKPISIQILCWNCELRINCIFLWQSALKIYYILNERCLRMDSSFYLPLKGNFMNRSFHNNGILRI